MNTETRMYGVFGDPVKHSKSPIMLNAAFREAGINAAYAAFHIRPGELEAAIHGIRALGFGGVNVTIPHKVEVMRYLDEIDEGARMIGAVNTVVNRDGKLSGYNTDGIGYVRSLKEETGITLEGASIVIIGAGGAARGIVYALCREKPGTLRIANRTRDKADDLAGQFRSLTAAKMEGIGLDELNHVIGEADLIVNTTSIGMHPRVDDVPLDGSVLVPGQYVSDLIYNPPTTRLLVEAEQRGCRIHGGLGMFIYQGAYAYEYWTGKPAPIDTMRRTVEESFR